MICVTTYKNLGENFYKLNLTYDLKNYYNFFFILTALFLTIIHIFKVSNTYNNINLNDCFLGTIQLSYNCPVLGTL